MIRQGLHIGVVSELMAREYLAQGFLRVLRTPEVGWHFSLAALYRKGIPLSAATLRFLEVARAVAREMTHVRRR